jgi:hypothetical protein
MSPGLRKLIAIAGGLLIAAAIAYCPWSFRDDIPVEADTFYWMTAMLWAPTALIVGIGAGLWFGYRRWPRKPRDGQPAAAPPRGAERSSFEA